MKNNKNSMDNGLTYELHCDLDFQVWENVVESSSDGFQTINFQPLLSSAQSSTGMMLGQENELLGLVVSGAIGNRQFGSDPNGLEEWQVQIDITVTFSIHHN